MKYIEKVLVFCVTILLLTTTAAAAKPYGDLKVALSEFGRETMDPASNTWSATGPILAAMYDSLIRHGPDAKLAPGIAEKWEMSKDGLSWMFYIRKGVKFHNGDPLTAKDVKFSLERFMNPKSQSPFSGTLKQNIKSVEVIDDYTVKVTNTATLPFFPNTLSMYLGSEGCVMPMDYIVKGAGTDFTEQSKFIDKAPVGSGPWKYVRSKQGDFVEFTAIEGHWRVTPAYKNLIIYYVPEDSTRLSMLKAGEVGFIEVGADRKAEIEAAPNLKLLRIPGAQNPGINFYGTYVAEAKDKPVSKLEVRKALSLAINRDEMIKYLLLGEGGPSLPRGITGNTLDVDVDYWKDYARVAYRYDPAEAKRLLAAAGYPNGFEMTMYTYAITGHPWMSKAAEGVAAYWGQVGVRTQIVNIEHGAIRALFKTIPPNEKLWGNASTAQMTVARMSIPTLGLETIFDSKGTFRLLNDPKVDKAINAPFTMTDPAERAKSVKDVFHLVNDQYVSIPLFMSNGLFGVSKEIGDWKPIPGNALALGELWETVQHAK